jgi:hypothetical protein
MWLNYLSVNWLRIFQGWLIGKKHKEELEELKSAISEDPILTEPPPPVKKGSLEDIREYCEEMRRTLKIFKKAAEDYELMKRRADEMYVEWGNLKDKVERFIERLK